MKKKLYFILILILFVNLAFINSVFADSGVQIKQKNGKFYVIKYGRVILKNYDKIVEITNTKDDFYYVELNGKCGILQLNGTPVLKPVYDSITNAQDNCFIVEKNGKYGIYDFLKNSWVFVPQMDRIEASVNGYYIIRENNKYGIYSIDKRDWLLNLSYDVINYEHNNFYVCKNGNVGLLNQFLNIVLPLNYDEIEYDEERDIYYINKNNKWGISDLYGSIIFKPEYQGIFPLYFNSSFVGYKVKLHSKFGIFNEYNKKVVPFVYNVMERFSRYDDEYLKVQKPDKFGKLLYGVIKYNGKKVIDCKYDEIEILKNENIPIGEMDNNVFVDKDKDNVFLFKQDNLWGVLNIEGKEIVFPNYQEICAYFYNQNVQAFVVKRNNRYGVVEVSGGEQKFKYINKSYDDIFFEENSKIIE